ncbi:hypothetical protein TNCV_1343851 [Trichonephila clavipes]|nr:hypothetical protein TNCV_1343851 [Trichonephila clavipes]
MSLTSFRVHQDATGKYSCNLMEKGDEQPPPHERRRMSLSSFRVHQDETDSRVLPRRKNGDEYPPPRG